MNKSIFIGTSVGLTLGSWLALIIVGFTTPVITFAIGVTLACVVLVSIVVSGFAKEQG